MDDWDPAVPEVLAADRDVVLFDSLAQPEMVRRLIVPAQSQDSSPTRRRPSRRSAGSRAKPVNDAEDLGYLFFANA